MAKKYIRQGTYTKQPSRIHRLRRTAVGAWAWFAGLKKWQKALLIATPFLAFLIITPIATYAYYAHDISDPERLMNRNNTGIVLTDQKGTVIYSSGKAEHHSLTPLNQISDTMKNALIASEDKDFYKHGGFSPASIIRALYDDILSHNLTGYGGSTLTQQLAKNTLLSNNQTILRKYQELAISIAIENKYSKDQILDMYLNSVFFGENAFGISDAAKTYFNETPDQLDLAQSAMLVGVLPAPSAYSPISGNATYAKERQTTVLSRMVTNGYITEAQKQAALAEKLTYAPVKSPISATAPHYTEMVLQELYNKYGEEQVKRSGYQVTTTLDSSIQDELVQNVAKQIPYINMEGGSNASAIIIDPKTGEIRALVGSADWNNPNWGKVNMTITKRQPGSSFKPIYYSKALATGVITPATILHDVPTDFGGGYRPLDADKRFRGDVTVRTALNESLNIPSVEVMQKFGVKNAIQAAKNVGITTISDTTDYGLSLALGTAEIPLEQMTNAYAAFANGGQQYTTTTIHSIEDKYGKTIYTNKPKAKQVISPQGAFLISDILSDNNAKAPIFGSSLTVPGKKVAVKTGTTEDAHDAWTIGYTPDYAVGVWVGNNDNTPMLSGGSDMAGPIWKHTFIQLTADSTPSFSIPGGIAQRNVCYGTEDIAPTKGSNTFSEYFLSDSIPSGICSAAIKVAPQVKQPEKKSDTTKKQDNNDSTDTTTTTPPSGSDSNTNQSGTGTGSGTSGGTGTGTGTGSGTSGGTGSGGTGTGSGTPTSGGTGGTTPPPTQ